MGKTLTVQQNLELLGRYRYTEIQSMEVMGSWAYTMVDPEIKIGFGRHMFQDSVHADLLGKRIPELKGRSQHFHSIPPSDDFVKLLEKVWRVSDELLRMVGLYRVLKPALVSSYRRHLEHLELPADEPTGYILRHIADEEQDHIDWADKVIERLLAATNRRAEVSAFQDDLSKDMQKCGGIWG